MQLQADSIGSQVIRPKMITSTSLGAAYLAGLGSGIFANLEEIKKIWKVDRTFDSKIDGEARHERLKKWQLAVRRATIENVS